MKFTLSWLERFLDIKMDCHVAGAPRNDVSLAKICDTLTALGIEVEQVIDRRQELAAFIVAEIIEATQHPNADRLRVCKVNNGKEILNIVCGAANARAGIKVVLAEIGVQMPNSDLVISQAKIRGEESFGMLCSASELTLSEESDGIIELPLDAKIGEKFIEARRDLVDPMIEVEVTPNRGDCFGVYGIARELAAAGIGKLRHIPIDSYKKSEIKSKINVTIDNNEDGCPFYLGKYFTGVKNQPSPKWLQNALLAIGEKPISALVDITNYMTFSFGRPLHVYDAKKLHGDIKVRKSRVGESVAALNGKIYMLDGTELVIADDKGVHGLAGIIGGADSGCDETTSEVFLECAMFWPETVTRTGRKHNIDTDARQRFERGIDPEFVAIGIESATMLIEELCGGKCSETITAGANPYQEKRVELTAKNMAKLSGVDIDLIEAGNILAHLGFATTKQTNDMIEVKVPSWRNDIAIEEDLIEEVLRIWGYDRIPALPLPTSTTSVAISDTQRFASQIRRVLVANGLNEVVTWSFMSSKLAGDFGAINDKLRIVNPISTDLDIMRATIIPNLLEVISRNHNRSFNEQAFFEIGPVFDYRGEYLQYKIVAGVRFGHNQPKNIHKEERSVDVFDAKADLAAALAIYGVCIECCEFDKTTPSYYHPARSLMVKYQDKIIGYFGEIHPLIVQKFDLPGVVVAFECLLENVTYNPRANCDKKISDFQPAERDFAFVLANEIEAGDVARAINNLDKALIKEARIFDVYKGKGVAEGKKSLAIAVKLQATDRTLTSEEIGGISARIVELVKDSFGGELRG